ncbi:MAG: tagaturonate epimerase family protein [Treponema sp.]|nr:tagaturonate epimerase family protein [Treponema sp.]
MEYFGFNAYEKSINKKGSTTVFMIKDGETDAIAIFGKNPGFKAEKLPGNKFKAPLNHRNAEVLRKIFPFTAPSQVLGKERSFGVGDRLGIAGPGHVRVFEKYDAYPVLAQQSIRELNLTGRTYEDVLDAASFTVFREGFKKAWGADGDHLKTPQDIKYALSLGFTMITLDCSDHINKNVTGQNAPAVPAELAAKYLNKNFDIGENIVLSFSEDDLKTCAAIYCDAIKFAVEMYSKFIKKAKKPADFEISIDETSEPTTPLQHYFAARELIDAGVKFATMAPRFCGEFQKGIDYIGDLKQFENEIKIHASIARHFKYKLSIHSGSDKFTVFPAIGKAAKGVFHVKTAGTNWLEAMRVVAVSDPGLYREIHKYAIAAFSEARKYYHVTTDLEKIPNIDKLSDKELPDLFNRNDSRQLIHITYGLILGKKNSDGTFTFRDRLYKLWREKEEVYAQALIKHIGKHLDLLGVKKSSGV